MVFRTIKYTDISKTESEKKLQERMPKVCTAPNSYYGEDTCLLELCVGQYLIDLFDDENGGDMLARIKVLRQNLKNEIGFTLPIIHFVSSDSLDCNGYEFFNFGITLRKGRVYPYKYNADLTSTQLIENDTDKNIAFSKAMDELIAQLKETILANIGVIEKSKELMNMI